MATERVQVGVALGIAGLCAAAALVTAVREPGPLWPFTTWNDGGRVHDSCAGAELTLSVHTGSSTQGTLRIQDPAERRWRVAWSAYASPITVRAEGGVVTTRTAFGDDDEGTSARARPVGASAWCRLRVESVAD